MDPLCPFVVPTLHGTAWLAWQVVVHFSRNVRGVTQSRETLMRHYEAKVAPEFARAEAAMGQ